MKTKDQVKKTKAYRALNTTQQGFALSKTNLEKIKHGLIVSKNIGLPKWKSMCGFTERNILIVEEIHNQELIFDEIKENQPKKESHA